MLDRCGGKAKAQGVSRESFILCIIMIFKCNLRLSPVPYKKTLFPSDQSGSTLNRVWGSSPGRPIRGKTVSKIFYSPPATILCSLGTARFI